MAQFGPRRRHHLFDKVIRWMLVPLVVLWPAAFIVTYLAASSLAQESFDRELRDKVRVVAEELVAQNGGRDLPIVTLLRSDPTERLRVHVSRIDGELVAGDNGVPVSLEDVPDGTVVIHEQRIGEDLARVASERVVAGGRPHLVQVAEPLDRRRWLVNSVTSIVMVVIVLLVPVTVLLVWLGLRQGLQPLLDLRARIEARAPQDLSPIDPNEVPSEISPLVNTLNHQLERVSRSLEAQRRFVADAAHALRTPLAGLKTQAQAAARDTSLDEARERLRRIEHSADRLGRLVAQLLTLARADEARNLGAREPIDLNGVVRATCEECANRAIAAEVQLGFDPAATEASIQGFPLLLQEMFRNLVDNAIGYTPAGGTVAVRVLQEEGKCEVRVQDDGPGIPVAERANVFQRFYRVLGTQGGGSGLGLAIVHAIAEMHRAHVSVDEGPGGRGTTVRVVFP